MLKRILFVFTSVVTALLLLCGTGCTGTQNDSSNSGGASSGDSSSSAPLPPEQESFLYGIAEPFAGTNVSGFNVNKEAELVGALGAKSFRLWMYDSHLYGPKYTQSLSEGELANIPKGAITMYETYIEALRDAGVEEITCMGMLFPRVPSTEQVSDKCFVPRRDTSEGSEYMQFLSKLKTEWRAVAAALPDVDVWEMANEINIPNSFFHYADGSNQTEDEVVLINVDYYYYARAGIKEGNPDAVVITPGYSPAYGFTGVASFLDKVYKKIEGGDMPAGDVKSADPDDYFDGVAWHPYDVITGIFISRKPDIDKWVSGNADIYNVMVRHGDGEKEVWFTEFGSTYNPGLRVPEGETDITQYTVNGVTYKLDEKREEELAEWSVLYLEAMKDMEYVHTVHYFRLCCSKKDSEWGGVGEIYFGLFLEPDSSIHRGFYPRKWAYSIQSVFGGTGDLMMYARD